MTLWQLAIQSLRYYWRTNLAVALGVAAATAVLTGALIVGDSMRQSLRALTIERLGRIDEMLVADGFFREQLATELKSTPAFQDSYDAVAPAILFPGGTVETKIDSATRRSGGVTVLGITNEFWTFGSGGIATGFSNSDSVVINQALANDLQIKSEQVAAGTAKITLRIPKQTQLPADSVLGKQDDLIESLVDLNVERIIPTEGLGRFGLHPTQSDPLNIYVPIKLLQDSLSRTVLKHKSDVAQANILLLAGKGASPPEETVTNQLRSQLRPTLEDYGLTLKRVTQRYSSDKEQSVVFDYWTLSSDQMILTDAAVRSIQTAFPDAKPVFTYLANDLRTTDQECGVPFSMVTAIDFDESFQPISSMTGDPIRPPGENEIVLNEWGAARFDARVGDTVIVTYFEPETTHGSQVEREVEMKLVDIAKLTEPIRSFVVPRRGPIEPPEYDQRPQITNDPDLTPEVPGVTDAESIENWDLPFDTAQRIEAADDDYWSNHRTTPKGFVSLATGQKLWHSRFGQTTSFRIPASAGDLEQLSARLLDRFAADENELGMHLVPIKRRGLAASSGSTPFDVLFLALSMFVIGSALILVALLFRLGFQQRASQVGLFGAIGFQQEKIRRIWLAEMSIVSLLGAVIGILLGIGYAWLMIWGLSTWWVGAISRPFLHLAITPMSLTIGLLSGLMVCIATIAWSLRGASRQNVRDLLAGQIESTRQVQSAGARNQGKSRLWMVLTILIVAIGSAVAATRMSGEAQAGLFMGAGFLVLAALLMLVYRWLRQPAGTVRAGDMRLFTLAILNAKRNPLRSTLTIGLVAVASFLIASVSAFRLTPSEQGTGGFDWVAQSSQPILEDLSTRDGQFKTLGAQNQLSPDTVFMPLRFKAGEDASCNNLYQSTQPRVLGVPPSFIEYFDPSANAGSESPHQFGWAGNRSQSDLEQANPWRLLAGNVAHAGTESDPIPVVIDKNTANYSLKIYTLNTAWKVDYDTGETVYFNVVGFLSNTILQGSLIVAERDFVQAFPSVGGYQYFLIRDGEGPARESSPAMGIETGTSSNVQRLEDRLGDYGFDARSAPDLLADFMAVQNTYLSTFQTLGGLGLLLGTFGLAAVQFRSVLERKQELGLMRAVGFSRQRLGKMVLWENSFLLLTGLAVGVGAALFTTLPHWLIGNASIPWGDLATMFVFIAIVGLLAGVFAARQIFRLPLLDSLRA